MQPYIAPYRNILPRIHPTAFIAPGAVVIGDVEIGAHANVWFGCIIRGDVNTIRIGEYTNIQDGTVVHVTRQTGPTKIGSRVTIGHAAVLHACTLEDGSFVGMRATLLDGTVVETGAMVAGGAVVTPKKRVLAGQIWAGNPAKYLRDMTQAEKDYIPHSAKIYAELAEEYR